MAPEPNLDALSDKARQALDPDAPDGLPLAAATGKIPNIPLNERLILLVAFSRCSKPKFAWASYELETLPLNVLVEALSTPQDPAVIHALAQHRAVGEVGAALITRMPNVAKETLEYLASKGDEMTCEHLAANEDLLAKHPELIVRLYMNQATRMSTADWLLQFAEERGIKLEFEGLPPLESAAPRCDSRKGLREPLRGAKEKPPRPKVPPLPRKGQPRTRINLLDPTPRVASRRRHRVARWVRDRVRDARAAAEQRRSSPRPPEHRLAGDPFSTDYVKKLRSENADLRAEVARKNAVIAAMTEERIVEKGKRLRRA